MKNFLLTAAALATLSFSASAQRMTLHEEFTGENCPPCASTNPDFWALCNGAANPSKLIHISYMVPIPSAGWYCNRTTAIYTSRDSYYNVPFAPYGRYDGHVPNPTTSSPGHPGYFTQADIDAEAARPDSFTVTATSGWNATYSQITTTVNVTCTTDWTGAGTTPNVKLRLALIKTDDFASSPGTNGETHFENVVQAMYPDVNGTVMPGVWTAGMTQSFVVTGTVPTWLDKSQNPYMVAWIQDDNNQSIAQAAKAVPLTLDVDAALASTPSTFCAAAASASVSPSITIKNTGINPLTSATIYYKFDGGTMASIPWTGSLAGGATAVVAIPATTLTAGGHTLYDSVASPNALADVNVINNASTTTILVINSTANALPLSTNFESALPANWTFFDANGNGQKFATATVTPHTGGTGTKAAKHDNYNYADNEANFIIMPTPTFSASSQLSFWVAYATYSASFSDKLEVLYSTDCGNAWTSLYDKSGATLSTSAATTSAFTPSAASQWRQEIVDVSAVPANAMVAFKATSNFGNNLYIDDVNMINTVAVHDITAASLGASIYPNPANDVATLSFNLAAASDIQVQVVDVAGRVLNTVASGKMNAGIQKFTISTASLAAGVYNVVIHTDNGVFTQRLSVAK